ncbi:PREDICTED: progesterone-induced-blocking factor 1-like [Priapulus caudatus]|uniref:Progesterone-induced-blocking factor 1-like n=1 Tax=Priapulus caudatus TaxID=37621 RepID=A0ABM1EQE0_PRICU|nr:PREDICTED: progesterone-induced-blocking factor 1-like [Priapulus caudatus]
MKTYDLERTQLVHDETVRDLSASRIDHEKLLKKTEVLKEEYHRLEVCAEGKVTELEGKLCEAREKLDAYEKLERELDDVIVQAAEVEDEREAERVMFAYGYGANVPSTAKRRMQQSVYLARRVLQLERANASLRREAERKEERERELSERVTRTSTLLLQEEEPPCGFLAERLRTRDDAVHGQRRRVATLEEEVRRLTRERDDLAACKNRLSADLERLLQQRDDIAALRRAILDLQRRLGRQGDADASSGRRGDDTGYLSGWESGGRVAGANGKEEEEGRRPAPITFTIGKSTVDRHGNKQPASVPTPGAKASKAYSISYS